MTKTETHELIKKLLRMAEHPNSNPFEAAESLARAQKLLFENNLTREKINLTESTEPQPVGRVTKTEENGYQWKAYLAYVLAKAMMCTMVKESHSKSMHFIGTYDNVRSVLEMFAWIVPQLEAIAISDFSKYRKTGGTQNGISWKTQFFAGATSVIKKRLDKPYQDFATGDGKAVCLYNDAAVAKAVKKAFPILHSSSRRVAQGVGYAAGQKAGAGIRIMPQKRLSGTLALGGG